MINTSSLYKDLVRQSGRLFKAKIIVTFPDGTKTELTDSDIMQDSLVLTHSTTDEGSFSIGGAVIGQCEFEIDNTAGKYNNMSFEDAEVDIRIGLVIEQKYDGTYKTEWLRKGIYTIEDVTVDEKYIKILAYDNIAKLDVPFREAGIKFPVTLLSLYHKICTYCSVPYSGTFPNSGITINSDSEIDENASCRDVISYIAQLACSFVTAGTDGTIRIGWYADTDYRIEEQQKLNGTVNVSGVQLTTVDDNVYMTGTKDYCIVIEENPLALNNTALTSPIWTSRLIGMQLTPFSSDILSDPSLEVGDIVTLSDLQGNEYRTPVTSIVYRLDGKMSVSCDAETVKEKQRTGCSPSAKIIAATNKKINRKISEYDVRAKQFSTLTANAMGYYQTEEIQDDGSVINYQHDKPLLADSQYIWKKSGDTLAVSNDGGKTWRGIDKDGNSVLNILAVQGIIADWIRFGTLEGIKIIAEEGSIAGWKMDNGVLVSDDGTMRIDSRTNQITIYDSDGNRLMTNDKNGLRFWRNDTEIGSIAVTKGTNSETYGLSFNLKNGDAMTWSVYDEESSVYVNKLRYEKETKTLKVNGNISISGDILDGNIADGVSAGGYKTATGEFLAVKDIQRDSDGRITYLTTNTIKVRNGLVTLL